MISIDTKKKELLGDFYREGRIDAQATIETNDHDFSSTGSGVVIPHGVYDVGRNRGFLHLNTSHDTSELACDSIAAWWDEHGRSEYPGAKKILVLCDGGGSNSATRYVFKEELQKLALRLGVEIRVAVSAQWNHTPPAPQRRPVAPVGDGRRNAAPRSHGYESRQRSVVTAGPILVHPGEARADI